MVYDERSATAGQPNFAMCSSLNHVWRCSLEWLTKIEEQQTMRVMVLVKATADSEKGTMPDPAMLAAMGKYNEELMKAGIMKDAAGLKPTSQGKRVAFDGADRKVIDGPFSATSEIVAGFWLWEVKDMDEAVAWVKKCPNPMPGPSEIEIRPFYEMTDFSSADAKGR